MKQTMNSKKVTSLDVAKFLGVEQDFKDKLFEEELKNTFENFKNAEFEEIKSKDNGDLIDEKPE